MGMILKWVLKYPKVVATGLAVIAIGAHFTHYKYLQGKVDRLTVQKQAMGQALEIAQDTIIVKEEALRIEREAVVLVTSERNNARRALSDFRAGRSDAESIEWAAQPIPEAERARMCEAVPELEGC